MSTPGAEITFLENHKSKHRDMLETNSEWEYVSSKNSFFLNHFIPAKFRTDNASIPDYIGYVTALIAGVLTLLLFLGIGQLIDEFYASIISICISPFLFLALFITPNDKRIRAASWFHDYGYRNQGTLIKQYWDYLQGETYEEKRESLRYELNNEMRQRSIQDKTPKLKAAEIFFGIHHTGQAKKIWKKGGLVNN